MDILVKPRNYSDQETTLTAQMNFMPEGVQRAIGIEVSERTYEPTKQM